MNAETVFWLILYGLLAGYYAVLCLLAWAVIRRIRWRWYSDLPLPVLILVGLIIVPGLEWGLLPGAGYYNDLRLTHTATGNAFLLGDPKLDYETDRSFHGDGYSIGVYRLSASTATEFEGPPDELFEDGPGRPWFRKDWQRLEWRRTPVRDEDQPLLRFALRHPLEQNNLEGEGPDDAEARRMLRDLAQKKGAYYGGLYNLHGESKGSVGDLDFFLIHPAERIFIVVNHNT